MRSFVVIVFTVAAASSTALAKPSVAQVVKDAKFTKVDCKTASPSRVASQEALFMNTRTKEIVSKTEKFLTIELECRTAAPVPGYPKARRMFDGQATYKSIAGGPWRYQSWYEWEHWIEGMPPLDPAIVETGIADRFKVIGSFLINKTIAIHSYGVRKDAPMRWRELDLVKLEVEAEIEALDAGERNLVRQRLTIPVMFANVNGTWEIRPSNPNAVEISRRTVTAEERKGMITVAVAERQRKAAERLAALPPVEIPAFAKEDEARAFVYKQLVEASPQVLESTLRRLAGIDPNVEEIDAAVAAQGAFKEQYCAAPEPKPGRPGFINKNDSFWTEISFVPAGSELRDGKKVSKGFQLAKINVGIVKGDQLAALKSYSYDLCGGVFPKASGGGLWKVGDKVQIAYIGSWQDGEIVKIVGGRMYVFDKRRSETKPLKAEDVREPQAEAPLPFKIGDRVEGKYQGRGAWYKGTVKDFNSDRDKAFIKYDDGSSEYLKFEHVRKL